MATLVHIHQTSHDGGLDTGDAPSWLLPPMTSAEQDGRSLGWRLCGFIHLGSCQGYGALNALSSRVPARSGLCGPSELHISLCFPRLWFMFLLLMFGLCWG